MPHNGQGQGQGQSGKEDLRDPMGRQEVLDLEGNCQAMTTCTARKKSWTVPAACTRGSKDETQHPISSANQGLGLQLPRTHLFLICSQSVSLIHIPSPRMDPWLAKVVDAL